MAGIGPKIAEGKRALVSLFVPNKWWYRNVDPKRVSIQGIEWLFVTKKTQLDSRPNVLKSLAGMVSCETHAQQMQQTHDAIRAAVKVTMRIPNIKQDKNKHKRKPITSPVTTTAVHQIVSQQNSSDSSVVRVPLDDAPTLRLQGYAPTQRASNEQT